MIGLMTLPIMGWTLGTLSGGVASGLLPQAIRDALGIMIYGMFLAIILPPCPAFQADHGRGWHARQR